MAFVTAYQGILFIEGDHPRAQKVQPVEIRVGGFGAQLKNLNDLKIQMADAAKVYNCNCIVNFHYGQKSKIIAIDDVAFIGTGIYARLSPDDYNSIMTKL